MTYLKNLSKQSISVTCTSFTESCFSSFEIISMPNSNSMYSQISWRLVISYKNYNNKLTTWSIKVKYRYGASKVWGSFLHAFRSTLNAAINSLWKELVLLRKPFGILYRVWGNDFERKSKSASLRAMTK